MSGADLIHTIQAGGGNAHTIGRAGCTVGNIGETANDSMQKKFQPVSGSTPMTAVSARKWPGQQVRPSTNVKKRAIQSKTDLLTKKIVLCTVETPEETLLFVNTFKINKMLNTK